MLRIKPAVMISAIVFGGICGFISTVPPIKAEFISHYFDPEYDSIKPRVSCGPGIRVIRGETQVIIPAFKSRCPIASIFKFNNGDILVQGKEQLLPPAGGDEDFIVKKRSRRSSDGGKTWRVVNYYDEDFPLRLESAFQYPGADGEVVAFADHTEEIKKTDNKTVHLTGFLRSKDNGLTWTKDTAMIRLDREYRSAVPTRRIVAIEDGSLVTSLYCSRFPEDKLRTLVIRSTDRGKTWDYLSTVAYDGIGERHTVHSGQHPLLRSLGFCEPSLAVLPDGRLYCLTRSGNSYIASTSGDINCETCNRLPFDFLEQTPVYMSISEDGGKSWSNADPVAPFGVFPDVVCMSNGIMAVIYGRPGNWMMFSRDKGVSWGPVFQFYHDLYPPDCSNYFSIAEVDKDILLAVYARTNQNDHWRSEIVGTYFKVVREAD